MLRITLLFCFVLAGSALGQSSAASPISRDSPEPSTTSSPASNGGGAATTGTNSLRPNGEAPAAKKITWSHANVDGPYIAMTFDDGPSAANTPRLLDLAEKDHIKLTFFLIGQNAARNPALVQRELADGDEIGNHTWTHPDLAKMSDDAVRQEIQKTQDAIINASGYRPIYLRPPYGALTARQRLWVNAEFGLKIIFWEVDPLDWKRPGVDVVAQRIITATRPGAIILSHDIHSQTVDAMPQVFDALLAKGYKFVTVSELLARDKGPQPSAASKSPSNAAQLSANPPVIVVPGV